MPVISVPQAFNEDELYVNLQSIFGQPLFLKCEGFNFAGSIKLKAATEMVEAADRDGVLTPGSVLVESSSGNLGVALSMIAASKGYSFLCVTDSRCNLSTRMLMEALGSQVHIVNEPDAAGGFLGARLDYVRRITVHDQAEDLIRSSDLIVFATIAGQPHVTEVSWFNHNPLVLHVSLRDLAPEILLASANVVDDVDHCLKANTSPHLAEQLTGNRDFLLGTLDDVMAGRVTVPADRPVVFSPFGLGVLDLAVGKYVYDEVARSGDLHVIDEFFHELRRYG